MRERLLHGGAFWAWRVGAALAQRLPPWISYPAAVAGGEIAYVLWIRRRRIAKANFSVVLDRPTHDREVARVARRSFRNFAKYVVEIMRFPRLELEDLQRIVTVEDAADLECGDDRGTVREGIGLYFGVVVGRGRCRAGRLGVRVGADVAGGRADGGR